MYNITTWDLNKPENNGNKKLTSLSPELQKCSLNAGGSLVSNSFDAIATA